MTEKNIFLIQCAKKFITTKYLLFNKKKLIKKYKKFIHLKIILFHLGTPSPKCPTLLNAEFIKLLMPLRKTGDGTELPNTATAAAEFAVFGVA